MKWVEFAAAAPELARQGRALFDRTGVLFIGTLRSDGSPRVSGCEFFFFDGELYLGMMWQSRKALDLLRDPVAISRAPLRIKPSPAASLSSAAAPLR